MIHLIGSSGFLGKSVRIVVNECGREDYIFYSSSIQSSESVYFDIFDKTTWENVSIRKGDKVFILSWKNLPNYDKGFHISENLLSVFEFSCFCVKKGASEIAVAGTCYEYGLQNGCLSEDAIASPVSRYAVAKDSLRRMLESFLSAEEGVIFKWFRIFYPYGDDQNPKSLYPSLMESIRRKDSIFKCSQGDQIRDFIHVDDCSRMMMEMIDSSSAAGVFNIGSGNPISIRDFLEKQISIYKSDITLELGFYPRRLDEPLAFWADIGKYKCCLNNNDISGASMIGNDVNLR